MPHLEHSPLGKTSTYQDQYDPSLLFSVPRVEQRAALGLEGALPFTGVDLWNAYELSWLDPKGKPRVALGRFAFRVDSPNIIESKSLKLYLNSFSQTRLEDAAALRSLLERDLAAASGAPVAVELILPEHFCELRLAELDGESIDDLDVEIRDYTPNPALLSAGGEVIEETLVSHLLKSNCPVTGQPDWGSVQIRYRGPRLDRAGLLAYIVSFRGHNEFHEHCAERIFVDLLRCCRPQRLTVYARYTRRGGLDINPFRSNWEAAPREHGRGARQ
ncbi:MAG TPA: NADPH-dependent 7-cyano-7-deazaguanine reductase QueF [Candidatus Competibacteraceae bacterium]|nr:NADPH-dependent 7-cyano-7-deazaguanine reductase QueF [Candidatus Competibacteraceae bacterium]